MTQDNILVVEDEIEIAKAIAIYLKSQNYNVYIAHNGKEGIEIIENNTIHLAIVDIMMPIMDGIEMTMKVREKHDFPIIFLSAKSEDIDKITGLNIGGDDYVTKPFVPMELLARVSSQLRRYHKYLDMVNKNTVESNKYVVGGLELDFDTKEIFLETLDEINTVARTAKQELENKFLATVACKAAVKAHMALTKEEVDSLMEQLLKLPNPFTCPHGRPTVIKMSKADIEKRFSRR